MARRPRFVLPGRPRHVIQRGTNRTEIFCAPADQNRKTTNKAWVLGDERFKRRVERQLKRRAAPRARGGERKSTAYRKHASINRV